MDLMKVIGDLFIERWDVKSWQQADGSYRPDRSPITEDDLLNHLAGRRSMGHYLVSPENRCKLFAYDIDLIKSYTITEWDAYLYYRTDLPVGDEINPREEFANKESIYRPWLLSQLSVTAEALARTVEKTYPNDVWTAIAFSGNKGVHVYGFGGSEDSEIVRGAGISVLESFGPGIFVNSKGKNFWTNEAFPCLEIETYPKQDTLEGKDLGNLMRLPMGSNLKSGKPGMFVQTVATSTGRGFRKIEPDQALDRKFVPWED